MTYKSIYTSYEIFHMNIPKKNIFLWLLPVPLINKLLWEAMTSNKIRVHL